MRKLYSILTLFILLASASASARIPERAAAILQQRAALAQTPRDIPSAPIASAPISGKLDNLAFNAAEIWYMGPYEAEDLFGDVTTIGSYFLILSTGGIDNHGELRDKEGTLVSIMFYADLPESSTVEIPVGEYTPGEWLEENVGQFDCVFSSVSIVTTDAAGEPSTEELMISDGEFSIAKAGSEYKFTLDLVAVDDDEQAYALKGSYTCVPQTRNADPSRCDLLPAGDYKLEIPSMRSSYNSKTKLLTINFYGTPMSGADRPGAATFPDGAGHFFSTLLCIPSYPADVAGTHECAPITGPYVDGAMMSGLWVYNNGIGYSDGTYLAVYDDRLNASYAFASQGSITITPGEDKAYRFDIDITSPEGAKVTGSWYGLLNGTPMGTDAIPTIGTDAADAPVEYFNLQGIRIDSPRAGELVVRRCGSQCSKVIF